MRMNRSVGASVQRLVGLPQHVRSCGASSVSSSASAECAHPLRRLRHDAEYGVVAADARPDLLVVFLGVAHLVKLGLPKQKRSFRFHREKRVLGSVKSCEEKRKIVILLFYFCSVLFEWKLSSKEHSQGSVFSHLLMSKQAARGTIMCCRGWKHCFHTHSRRQHWSSEPDSVPLHVMSDDLHINGLGLQKKQATSQYYLLLTCWRKKEDICSVQEFLYRLNMQRLERFSI